MWMSYCPYQQCCHRKDHPKQVQRGWHVDFTLPHFNNITAGTYTPNEGGLMWWKGQHVDKAGHGCTCGFTWTLPTGIFDTKTHIQTCKDLFPHITWICRSKACGLWVLAGKPPCAGIQGYLKVNPQVIVETR